VWVARPARRPVRARKRPSWNAEDNDREGISFGTSSLPRPPGKYPGSIRSSSRCRACSAEHAPCVTVCPAKATYRREDGIVVPGLSGDALGANTASFACPYGARSFNSTSKRRRNTIVPTLPPDRNVWCHMALSDPDARVVENAPSVFIGSTSRSRRARRLGTEVVPALCGRLPSGARKFETWTIPAVRYLPYSPQGMDQASGGADTKPKVYYLLK